MVWLVEKKVIYHTIDMGFELVEIPVGVKFEFEVKVSGVKPQLNSLCSFSSKNLTG